MLYKDILSGYFIERPNRFIAHVNINGQAEVCHVKNTGRCKELLKEGSLVYVQKNDDPKRKTKYSLIAVQKGDLLINMDSQAPNKAVYEWLQEKQPWGEIKLLKPETKYKDSRFDFYLETDTEKMFIEVKGVTLEDNGVVSFPDAPTERGVRHITELIESISEGYKAAVIFVIQMEGVKYFTPNRKTHAAFADILRKASLNGVKIMALECAVRPDSMKITKGVPVKLR